jgi:hypothetical protein
LGSNKANFAPNQQSSLLRDGEISEPKATSTFQLEIMIFSKANSQFKKFHHPGFQLAMLSFQTVIHENNHGRLEIMSLQIQPRPLLHQYFYSGMLFSAII